MLLHSYKIIRILPCLADPEKIRVIAEISGEIHEVFPYLNATLEGCIYNHPALTLTFKKDDKLITLHAINIKLAKIQDEKEAEEILKWLQNLINETYQNRDRIKPDHSMRKELKPTDILKLLPGTNCRECGERTCFAFAFKLVRQETEISKCTFLFSEKYLEKGKVLLQLLKDVGYNLSSKEGRQDG